MRAIKFITAVLISLIFSVGIIGASYSYFSGTNSMSSKLLMGDIDVRFSELSLLPESESTTETETAARILNNGKSLELEILNAYPGYTALFDFEITNRGTVPVGFSAMRDYCVGGAINISVNGDLRYIKGHGGKASGQLLLSVDEAAEKSGGHAINAELNFQQAIVEVG